MLPAGKIEKEVNEMYRTVQDLPEPLREYLPENLQQIYLDAYQASWKKYDVDRGGEADRESVAHRDGMKAVHKKYTFHEETKKWYPIGEAPPEGETPGILDRIKEVVEEL
jgi:cation transport regulator